MLALDPVALLQLDKFFLNLFRMCLYVVEDGLVYGEPFVDLSETLVQILVLEINLVFEKSTVSVQTSQFIIDYVENLEFRTSVKEGVVELLNSAV